MAMRQRGRYPAKVPVQHVINRLDDDAAITGMFILARIGGEFMAWLGIRLASRATCLPILTLAGERLLPPGTEAIEPWHRLLLAQPIEQGVTQHLRDRLCLAIGQDDYADLPVRQHVHPRVPANPATVMADSSFATIVVAGKAKPV